MPTKELVAKYGGPGTKTRDAINRAIRAECAGGNEALDALERMHKFGQVAGWKDPQDRPSGAAVGYGCVLAIVHAMEDRIREAYGLPPRELAASGKRRR